MVFHVVLMSVMVRQDTSIYLDDKTYTRLAKIANRNRRSIVGQVRVMLDRAEDV